MANDRFKYCKGVGCPLSERCVHFVEGQNLPEGDWSWMNDCGEEHPAYLPFIKNHG